jgi:CHAT domain-containing protein
LKATLLKKGQAPELTEKHNRLIAQLSDMRLEIHQTDSKDKRTLARLQRKKKDIQSELDRLMITIRSENPVFSSVHYPQPMSLDMLTNTLKPNETLVQYVVTPEKIFSFVVSKERFKIVPLKITVKNFGPMVSQFGKLLRDSPKDKVDLRHAASVMYRDIFKPLEKYLVGAKDLVIVPDGELALIPFESLIVERGNIKRPPVYLLEKYRIKYAQSATVLKMVRDHYRRQSTTNRFIGFGDPVYDYENFSQGKPEKSSGIPHRGDKITESLRGKYQRGGGIYDRLENSNAELTSIGDIFTTLPNGESVLRLRDQALEEEVKSKTMKDYDYIHLSCHGLLSDDFQSLVFSQNIPAQTDNGFLTLNEIMNCRFDAKLVVLSACQSGAGKLEKGEGVTGLTRAVMYAGTPAVIASLWTVGDVVTKKLMVKFYKNLLKQNMTKSEALRQAKLSLIKNGSFKSPRLWSAFVLYGE